MMTFELKRKGFHFLSIIFPILYYFASKNTIINVLIITNFIVLSLDISRHYFSQIQEPLDKIFASIMRPNEKSGLKNLSGSSYMFLGFLLTAIFFDKEKVIIAWFILIIADSLASLVGKKFGVKLASGKSLIGSIAFAISALVVVFFMSKYLSWGSSPYKLILATALTSVGEFYSQKIKI